MSAPITPAAREVLRALACDLKLQQSANAWAFIGYWQDPEKSRVPHEVISELLHGGFIRVRDDSFAELTGAGYDALNHAERQMMDTVLEWLRSRESPF